jgi:hypothetical protein
VADAGPCPDEPPGWNNCWAAGAFVQGQALYIAVLGVALPIVCEFPAQYGVRSRDAGAWRKGEGGSGQQDWPCRVVKAMSICERTVCVVLAMDSMCGCLNIVQAERRAVTVPYGRGWTTVAEGVGESGS